MSQPTQTVGEEKRFIVPWGAHRPACHSADGGMLQWSSRSYVFVLVFDIVVVLIFDIVIVLIVLVFDIIDVLIIKIVSVFIILKPGVC